jgi:hypothetical protein
MLLDRGSPALLSQFGGVMSHVRVHMQNRVVRFQCYVQAYIACVVLKLREQSSIAHTRSSAAL